MVDNEPGDRTLIALENGLAAADLSHLNKVGVAGAEAVDWLDALLTSDVSELAPGQAQRSLFLSATGRIRADLTVARNGDGVVLLQDPSQPEPILETLAPYVLSAAVELSELNLAVFSVPRDPQIPGTLWSARPSPIGGILIALPAQAHGQAAAALAETFVLAAEDDLDRHRIREGVARFPVDLLPTSIPAEAGLDATLVDATKGCFPGQESVAKVRNLGHPATQVLALWTNREVVPGEPVFDAGDRAGQVTSAAVSATGTHVIARVRWSGSPRNLSDGKGHRFEPLPG